MAAAAVVLVRGGVITPVVAIEMCGVKDAVEDDKGEEDESEEDGEEESDEDEDEYELEARPRRP